jgi:hypothetical protein
MGTLWCLAGIWIYKEPWDWRNIDWLCENRSWILRTTGYPLVFSGYLSLERTMGLKKHWLCENRSSILRTALLATGGSVPVSNNRPKINMVIRDWLHLDMNWTRVIETDVPSMDRHKPLAPNGLDMVWNAVINHRCDQWLNQGRLLDTNFEWLFDFVNWLLVPVIAHPSKNQWISRKNRERTNSFIEGYLTCWSIFWELWRYNQNQFFDLLRTVVLYIFKPVLFLRNVVMRV